MGKRDRWFSQPYQYGDGGGGGAVEEKGARWGVKYESRGEGWDGQLEDEVCTGAEGRGTGQEGLVNGISEEHVLELRDRQDGVNGMSMKHVQSLEETDRMVSMEQV